MDLESGDWVRLVAVATAVAVPLYALRQRGRRYATWGAVILALSLPGALVSHWRLADLAAPGWRPLVDAAFAWGVVAAGLHMIHLVRARLRSPLFRAFVSLPGQTFTAAGFMAGWWLLALLPVRGALWAFDAVPVLDALRWLDLAPFLLAAFSVATSLRPAAEWVRIPLGGPVGSLARAVGAEVAPFRAERARAEGAAAAAGARAEEDGGDRGTDAPGLVRVPVERHRRRAPDPLPHRPLRIVQITDPHLGPWQPVARLQRHIERLLGHDPDLVLLTGDFLTMEGQGTPGALAESLAPLRGARGRCFAVFGNHDHEAPQEVRSALEESHVRLLMDEEVVTPTPVGPVQILGADYVRRGRREHLEALLARHPRLEGHLRLLLLHDPVGFRHLPDGAVDLTLSGHTHGGQVGLLSFGLDWTVLRRSRWPDHGLFARGTNRLYVHRGTGFYGFPLRVGVPGELSVLELIPRSLAS